MTNTDVATREEQIASRIDKAVTGAMAVVKGGGITFANATEVMEYARMMSVSGSAVPKHLRNQPGACLGIIDDAMRYQMSPYALARKSFFVNDNLAYEAQVIAAIIIRWAPLTERPDITFTGEGQTRKCLVTFKFIGGAVRTYQSPYIKDIKPKNSPLWINDPDQQLSYFSLRAGARRHCPEVILGMYDYEETASMVDVTPAPRESNLAQRLQDQTAAAPTKERNGFSAEHVDKETGEITDQDNSPSTPGPQDPPDENVDPPAPDDTNQDPSAPDGDPNPDEWIVEDTLLDQARGKANEGGRTWRMFKGGLTIEQQKELAPHMKDLEALAKAA